MKEIRNLENFKLKGFDCMIEQLECDLVNLTNLENYMRYARIIITQNHMELTSAEYETFSEVENILFSFSQTIKFLKQRKQNQLNELLETTDYEDNEDYE